jgi:tRNA(Ile2) C34 agmatinyltransferase TiaS
MQALARAPNTEGPVMTEPIVKYATAPTLVYNYPSCGSCHVEVESDDGDFVCRTCGTS